MLFSQVNPMNSHHCVDNIIHLLEIAATVTVSSQQSAGT
jgi:hypothetical protein